MKWSWVLIIRLGCTTSNIEPDYGYKRWFLTINNNYNLPLDVNFLTTNPTDFEKLECDTAESVIVNLEYQIELSYAMDYWEFCTNEIQIRVYEKKDASGNRKMILTKDIVGTGEDLTMSIP